MTELTVNIPDAPEGYKYTGVFKQLEPGDMYVSGGRAEEWVPSYISSGYYFTLERLPTPESYVPNPLVFKPGWIVADLNGDVYWFLAEPVWDVEGERWRRRSMFYDTAVQGMNRKAFLPDVLPHLDLRGKPAIWEVKERDNNE